MGGTISKKSLGTIYYKSNRNIEIRGRNIETLAKGNISEKGENDSLDVKLGIYSSPSPVPEEKVCTCNVAKKATNFTGLVALVKQAEELLIENGKTNVEDRICILRGIYYGTTWSMDYEKEKSTARNLGFRTYTLSAPEDARPLLKCSDACKSNLFEALKQSAEVFESSTKAFDWGHAIIGLDCRRNGFSRRVPLPTGGTGLEACTWVGDVGGGVGMLSYRRASNPDIKAKSLIFGSRSDYGAMVNLEGDIGGYLIARKFEYTYDSPVGLISDFKIYEELEKYLLTDPNEWNNRGRIFLEMLGGEFDADNQLINRDSVIEKITETLAEFADSYIFTRSLDNSYPLEKVAESSRHFNGAANEAASILIDGLLHIIKKPNDALIARTDPNPSEPGEILTKYKAMKKAQEIREDIKDKAEEIMKDGEQIIRQGREALEQIFK